MARKLTPKQLKFLNAYIELGNATEAYRQAYSCKSMKEATIKNNAYKLLQNGDIATTIAEIQSKAAEKVALNEAWVLDRLMKNAKIALGEEKITLKTRKKGSKDPLETIELELHMRDATAANRALELLGKKLGIFVDRIETKDLTPVVPVVNVTIGNGKDGHTAKHIPSPKAGPSVTERRH